jgi:hypothetical protein
MACVVRPGRVGPGSRAAGLLAVALLAAGASATPAKAQLVSDPRIAEPLALASVAGADPQTGGATVQVSAANTKRSPELRKTVPITRKRRKQPRVIMSLPLRRLGDLARGDRLRFTAEYQVTTDCTYRSPRCAGRPYPHYSPSVESRLILARQRFTKGGRGAMPLTRWRGRRCSHGEHHCVYVHAWDQITIRRLRRLPCKPIRCRINLVVSATSPQSGRRHKLVVGGNKPDGYIAQDRGRISAIRLHGRGSPDLRKLQTRKFRNRKLRMNRRKRVIYAIRVPVRGGDVIAASAKLIMATGTVPYRFRTGAQLITARSATETSSRGYAKQGVSESGEVGEMNGFNCKQSRPRCVLHKTGMLWVWKRSRATRMPLFVNLVVEVNPKRATAGRGDRAVVGPGGKLRVRRYRSASPEGGARRDHRFLGNRSSSVAVSPDQGSTTSRP